jgi:hypothetical protein
LFALNPHDFSPLLANRISRFANYVLFILLGLAMTRRFIFADEAGDFTFSRGNNISRYFIVCTVMMDSCKIGEDLLWLRRELAWKTSPLNDYFHATADKQQVRDEVFRLIQGQNFAVYATIMEKSKAQPQVRSTHERFYKYGWLYLFRHGIINGLAASDELLITAASVKTKKAQGAFTDAVNDVIQQHLPRAQWRTSFCPCACDPCLQIADYCTWAIQRKWERGDDRSYKLIKSRMKYEYDLWAHGTRHYY